MARIPKSEIERLKQEISLQRMVEFAGIALKRHGADLIGLCPFHDDKTPSLVITDLNNAPCKIRLEPSKHAEFGKKLDIYFFVVAVASIYVIDLH